MPDLRTDKVQNLTTDSLVFDNFSKFLEADKVTLPCPIVLIHELKPEIITITLNEDHPCNNQITPNFVQELQIFFTAMKQHQNQKPRLLVI